MSFPCLLPEVGNFGLVLKFLEQLLVNAVEYKPKYYPGMKVAVKRIEA
jgi:hypothetical protein